jgi:hypothetical protein
VSARPAARSARVKPHKVRGRELEEVREKDPDGRIVVHHRTVDTLGKMLRSNLDPLRALPILRVPGTGREPELNERQLHARRRVRLARGRPPAERARVGASQGLGRSAGEAGTSSGRPGRGTRGAGGSHRAPWTRSGSPEGYLCDVGRPLPHRRTKIGSVHGHRRS